MKRWSVSGLIGLALVAVFVIAGIAGPYLAPYDPTRGVLADRFAPPSFAHWLGTDATGVDAQ
jgi:ABC-type dipeptide/oligopeptide/nickel transport system permease subunit